MKIPSVENNVRPLNDNPVLARKKRLFSLGKALRIDFQLVAQRTDHPSAFVDMLLRYE